MALDPRSFVVKDCSAYKTAIVNSSNARKDFFNGLGKLGDFQVLNDLGAGKIATGLRVLAGVSNSVRTGDGAVPSVIGSTVDSGVNYVLNTMGIDSNKLAFLQDIHPEAANGALGQAKALFEQVKNGNLDIRDIPQVFSDVQNFERLLGGIFTPSKSMTKSLTSVCSASPYAVDLAYARAPKYEFLFVVEFIFNDAYTEFAKYKFAFVVKKSSRLSTNMEYDTVNMYNFRTKVLKSMTFDNMKMSFYDDQTDQAFRFYQAYLKAISPMSNIAPEEAIRLDNRAMDFSMKNVASMKDGQVTGVRGHRWASPTGPLLNNNTSIIKQIRLYHMYDWGRKMNLYTFSNPRIESMDLSELDMESNNAAMVNINFSFDLVHVEPVISPNDPKHKMEELSSGGLYPIRYRGEDASQGATSATNQAGGSVLSKITGEVKEGISGVTNAVSSAFDSVTKTAGTAVADTFGGLGKATSSIFSGIGNVTSSAFETVTGPFSGLNNDLGRISQIGNVFVASNGVSTAPKSFTNSGVPIFTTDQLNRSS